MPTAIQPGTRIGSYEVIAAIGAGGMGEVHRARDTKLNRDVAIKVLPDLFAHDADRLARFQREAQVLAALNHPNIAQIYGLEDSPGPERSGVCTLVMELVEGEDLEQRLTRGPLPVDEAIAIGAQIADALEAAHEQGIIHRDLKPANVKVRPDGTVKVLDFGLAKAIDPGGSAAGMSATMSPTLTVRATQLGTIIGTAAYMAPEQAKGKAVDRRVDIWAFGAVLYEILTGQRAFKGDDVSDTLAAVLRQELDFQPMPADVPAALRKLIERCLAREPRQRLRDIGEARVLLEKMRAGVVEEEKSVDSVANIIPVRPIWKRALAPAAVTIFVAVISAYAAWIMRPTTARPVTRFAIVLPEDQVATNVGRKMLALSPDGSNLAYVANREIFIRPLGGFDAHAIPGSDAGPGAGGIQYVVFSPDGQELAYRTAPDTMLRRLPVAGGASIAIAGIDNPFGMSWTDYGILFGVPGKGIVRVSPRGGNPEIVAAVAAEEIPDAPDLLPGGKALMFSVRKRTDSWDKGAAVVETLESHSRKTVINGAADAKYVSSGHIVYAVGGVLFAVPFDLGSLSVTGGAVAVVQGVRRTPGGAGGFGTATAHYAIASNGALAYIPGPATIGNPSENDLAVFDRKGSEEPLKLPAGRYAAPRVSPDGKWVAFERESTSEAAVYVYELAGTTAIRRLTFGGRSRAPVWSGDSRWVAFQSDHEGDLAVFRQLADGTGPAERLTKPEKGAAHIPQSWSPDNRQLLYTEERSEKHSLHNLAVNDKTTSTFGVEGVGLVEASFSPDGKWVAFSASAEQSRPRSTYVVPFPPTGAKYLVPIDSAGHAFWDRDGQALNLNVGPGQSAVVAVKRGPPFGFGAPGRYQRGQYEPSPGTTRRNADAMPDGRILGVASSTAGFAARREATAAARAERIQINVVLNWLEELRQRVR